MVPGLAVERRKPGKLRKLIGSRPHQRQFTLLRQHQQQALIGQQHELAIAVAAALPFALAVFKIDAREDASVEAEGITIVNYEVVEIGLQSIRGPTLLNAPSGGPMPHCQAARAATVADADENVAVRGQSR